MKNRFRESEYTPDRPLEITIFPDTGTLELGALSNAIQFEDVSSAYNSNAPVLCSVSFRVNRGEVVAIVGANGAGKSSVANLVPRYFDVTSGTIRRQGVYWKLHSLQFPEED